MLRTPLLALSHNRTAQRLLTHSRVFRRAVRRFVAGETLDEALSVVADLNARGLEATLDLLGEATALEADARRAAGAYRETLLAIAARGLRCHVSVKLSQLGLDISCDLARELLSALVAEAARDRTFVRVDMEDSARLPAIFEAVERVWDAGARNVGVAVQAYLYRSQDDVARLTARGVPVRLCKGAYAEPSDRAFPRKADVDRQFAHLAEYLLTHAAHVALATHDERLIRRAIEYASAHKVAPDRFEFQLLHGIRRDLQETLPRQGYRVRVYVPFGTHWYPYFMRRLAERPANLLFMIRHLARA